MYSYDKIKEVIEGKGYAFFTGNYNINLIGVRNPDNVNEWNDTFLLVYQIGSTKVVHEMNDFTTDPGSYYLQKKFLSPKGCAILAEGQYRGVWKLGMHGKKPYPALVQLGGPVTVYRDRDKDNELDFNPDSKEKGWFGINLHHGYDSADINWNSAGCQVFKYSSDLNKVLSVVRTSKNLYGNSFTYTLLNERDFKS